MPIEIIGEFGTPGASSEWIEAQGKLAIRHIVKTCGDPPPEMNLEVVWQGHELGFYPEIGLIWEDPFRGVPSNYVLSWHGPGLLENMNGIDLASMPRRYFRVLYRYDDVVRTGLSRFATNGG